MKSYRRVIRVEDIEKFFKIKTRAAYARLAEIKQYYGKQKHQPITIKCFCEFYDITEEEIQAIMD